MTDHATLVLLLAKLEQLATTRAQDLIERVERGDESAWADLLSTAITVKVLLGSHEPARTTAQIAAELGSP